MTFTDQLTYLATCLNVKFSIVFIFRIKK